jgi:hypothetical protein
MYQSTRHFMLEREPWDEATARAAIREIVADALQSFDPVRFWPAHPMDDDANDGQTDLYVGAAGTIWALDYLHAQGVVEQYRDFRPVLGRLRDKNRKDYGRYPYPDHGSLLLGDVGVLLLTMRLSPAPQVADELFQRIAPNLTLPILELMWGMPGSMLACVFMAETTGENRWRISYQAQASRLLAALEETEHGPLWPGDLYGQPSRYLGPVHGYAGNMLALIRGWHWLDAAQQDRIANATARTLAANARHSDMGVNWCAQAARGEQPELVQYCHGAPGMVCALADLSYQSDAFDALLRAGGEFTWRAGPLTKGSSLCHGTGGNGYAFLKLHRRLRDPVWLERARTFAMTAITQCRAARIAHGMGRYTLWTGDLGLAVFLWDCITGEPRFPTTDVF